MYDATEATTSLKIVSKLVKENSNSRLYVRVLMQSSCFCSLNYAKFGLMRGVRRTSDVKLY